MATPISVSFNLAYTFGGSLRQLQLTNLLVTITGSNFKQESQTIPTTAGGTAISVAGLVTPRWCAIINRDGTNYVGILTAVAGIEFMRLLPGEGLIGPLAPGIVAPAALANGAPVQLEILVMEN